MKLSFIIPAYNVENYIDACLESILNQDLNPEDYEIVVVNDGSTDSTLQHILKYKNSHPHFRVIDQENQGLSMARNNGVSQANGEYIWFVDGDDTICPNCLKILLGICDSWQTDMFCVGPSIPFKQTFPHNFIENDNITALFTGESWIKSNQAVIGAWAYIIKRRFWIDNDLKFVRGISFEDTECMSRSFYFAKRISGLNRFSVYNYIQREQSIMHSKFDLKKLRSILVLIKSLNDFSRSLINDSFFYSYYRKICLGAYMSGLKQIANNQDLKTFLDEYVSETKRYGGVKITASSFFERLYQFIAIHFPSLFIRIGK